MINDKGLFIVDTVNIVNKQSERGGKNPEKSSILYAIYHVPEYLPSIPNLMRGSYVDLFNQYVPT